MTKGDRISPRGALSAFGAGLLIPGISRIVFALDHADPAPRFRAKTMDGESVDNDSLRSKIALFQFWATWGPYCKRDMAALERIGQEFAPEGLVVYGVDMGESKKKVRKFLEE